MSSPGNPLAHDPAIAAACDAVRRGDCGQLLAVYAVARVRGRVDDPIVELGLPLIAALLDATDEVPERVTATRTEAPGGFAHWSLVIRFASGLCATVDLGAELGRCQPGNLDLRIEWTGADRVIQVEPTRVAVTVANEFTTRARSAEVAPIAEAIAAFAGSAHALAAEPVNGWERAAAVIQAARASLVRSVAIPV